MFLTGPVWRLGRESWFSKHFFYVLTNKLSSELELTNSHFSLTGTKIKTRLTKREQPFVLWVQRWDWKYSWVWNKRSVDKSPRIFPTAWSTEKVCSRCCGGAREIDCGPGLEESGIRVSLWNGKNFISSRIQADLFSFGKQKSSYYYAENLIILHRRSTPLCM